MSSTALIGATMSGALTYVGCTVGAHLDSTTAMVAAAGVAAVVGAGITINTPKKEEGLSAEEEEWEKELMQGGTADLTAEDVNKEEEAKKAREEVAKD